MDYDKILVELGEFGPWQQRNALMLWLPAMADGINILIAAFVMSAPDRFRCRNSCDGSGDFSWDLPGNLTEEQLFPSLDEDYINVWHCESSVRQKLRSCLKDKCAQNSNRQILLGHVTELTE